ncbi:MAG: phosphate acyltransferase [candidate division WOR-3 bacterium]
MEPIKSLDEMVKIVRERPSKRLVVANGHDPHTIEATYRAAREKLVNVTLVGDKEKIEKLSSEKKLDISIFEIIDIKDVWEAGELARNMVIEGRADILMKGLIPTDIYMKIILHGKEGLLRKGNILSHVAVVEVPNWPRLLFISDIAVIPAPNENQKTQMLKYAIKVAHAFGLKTPKAALIAATERVSDKMQATLEAANIAQRAEKGEIPDAIVDGPLAIDLAVSKEACEIKGFKSKICGDADILIFPCIESANVFFKTLTEFAGASLAGIVMGTSYPCVLTSRADSEKSKFYSIALAAFLERTDV